MNFNQLTTALQDTSDRYASQVDNVLVEIESTVGKPKDVILKEVGFRSITEVMAAMGAEDMVLVRQSNGIEQSNKMKPRVQNQRPGFLLLANVNLGPFKRQPRLCAS